MFVLDLTGACLRVPLLACWRPLQGLPSFKMPQLFGSLLDERQSLEEFSRHNCQRGCLRDGRVFVHVKPQPGLEKYKDSLQASEV